MTPGDHTIMVRATDGTGETQTDMRTAPAPDGARGWDASHVRGSLTAAPPGSSANSV